MADEVRLTNGDRITGTIIRMEQDSLVLKTFYGGEIRLDWNVIEGFQSTEPVTIELHDGSQLRGIVDASDPEEIIMIDPEEVITPPEKEKTIRKISLATISAINPLPAFQYEGNTSFGGNRTAGNSSTQAVNASADWTFRFLKKHRAGIGGRYNYGESHDTVTARNSRASLSYDYFVSEKIFLNFDELFEQDSFQDLTVRSSTTIGLGYQFFDSEEHTLAISAGPGFVLQDFQSRATIRNPTGLWSIDWKYWLIPNGVEVFVDHQGFQDFGGNSSALRVNSRQGFRLKLNRYMFVTFQYDLRFNSRPLFNNKKLDEALIFGIGFDLKN
ncbi:MAG: DUF481 domain-containing protein [Nitrospirales bacterium]|nr:DUF481 domain-containing protein [Nitrospira sp.]MDR4500643.1 DUF481 domain-containing protein [Nitrospirales bacterium]